MVESSIRHHMERTHRKVMTHTGGVYIRGRGGGDIYGVIPMNSEISGMTSVGVPGKG